MSVRDDKLSPAELRDVERLVDGELDLTAQQQLLRRLESAPDGWRRCALAFLESQALAQVLIPPSPQADERLGVRGSSAIDAALPPTPLPAARKRIMKPAFALAASFLVAFALGLALRSSTLNHNMPAGVDLAQPSATSPMTDSMAHAAPEAIAPAASSTPPPSDAADENTPIQLVGSADGEVAPRSEPRSLIPPRIRRALERMGHRVEEHREMLPIELEDGTQGYVPAERIELHYIGNQYQ